MANTVPTYVRDPIVISPVTIVGSGTLSVIAVPGQPIPVMLSGGSVSFNLNPGDVQIGDVAILDEISGLEARVLPAADSKASSEPVLLVQNVDRAGGVLTQSTVANIDTNTATSNILLLEISDTGSAHTGLLQQISTELSGESTENKLLAVIMNGQGTLATSANQVSSAAAVAAQTVILTAILNNEGTLATSANQASANSLLTSLLDNGTKQLSAIQNYSGTITLKDSAGRMYGTSISPDGDAYLNTAAIQDVHASTLNSSSVNVNANGSFVGLAESTLGVAGIQVMLKTSHNCTVNVDQSPDSNGANWDCTDAYTYYAADGGKSWTTQAVGSAFRVRVLNTTGTTTNFFRLGTALCPVVEALPRATTDTGFLKSSVQEIETGFGQHVLGTPMNQLQTAGSFRLAGAAFSGTNPVDSVDTNYWSKVIKTGLANATQFEASGTLSTGTTANGDILLNSVRTARYVGGAANRYRGIVRVPTALGANVRRWGAFDATDGYFFQWDGSALSVVSRKSGTDTPTYSNSFNGEIGGTFTPNSLVAYTYEIFYTNKSAWFMVDGLLLHKLTFNSTTGVGNINLKIGLQNTNSAGNVNDNQLMVRTSSISRLGNAQSQPVGAFQSGQIASRTLKYGTGNLRSATLSALTNNSIVTLYDNTSATGTIIWSSGAHSTGNLVPYPVNFNDIVFSTGLALAVTGANLNILVIYE